MVRSVEHYPSETIVVVHGKLRKAAQRVKNATIHDYEIDVYEVHKVSNLTENVPFTVYDAENINRDKEDVAEDNVNDAEEETPVLSPNVGTPRSSTDLSRLSQDLLSRSESFGSVVEFWELIILQPVWKSRERREHCPKEYD